MIFQFYVNPVMGLLETIFLTILTFTSFYIIYRMTPEKSRIKIKYFSRNAGISSLISFGIIFCYKLLMQILESFHTIFASLYKDTVLFGIMVSIFTLFYRIFVIKVSKQKISYEYKRWNNLFIISCFILSILFFSIDFLSLLNIPIYIEPLERAIIVIIFKPENSNEAFFLSFFNAFVILFLIISLSYFINRARNIKLRIPKPILKKTIFTSSFIAYFIWSFQIFLFGAFFGHFFNIGSIELDFRVQILIIIGIYFVSFFYFLKYKYIPEGAKESKKRFEDANHLILERESKDDEKDLIIKVEDLKTYFYTEEGIVRALEGVSFEIYAGEILGLVGETGCGKTVTALSLQNLILHPGVIEEGKVIYDGEDLLKKSKEEILKYRGKEIAMIFQDPLNSLNPVFSVGQQISEVFLINMEDELIIESSKDINKNIQSVAREWSERILTDLKIPNPKVVYDLYPHELSGGMRQRIQIAMALACSPKLLIADEPTTALDVTVQNQILQLMKDLLKKYDTSILFITHDLGIISKMCDRVAVMYSGFIVEYGERNKLFKSPCHPYTIGLLNSIPKIEKEKKKDLPVIPGSVPNLIYPPSGCRFHPRCQYRFEPCDKEAPIPLEIEKNYYVACHLYDPKLKNYIENSGKKLPNL
ncbi:MAG: oligopeptide/dipeptide ABC transporter ATP-binding protein [Promethearchaeota archaeon]